MDIKWPAQLTFIRHGESAYNILKSQKKEDPTYQDFLNNYEKNPESEMTRALGILIQEKFSLGVGDHNTPLTDEGHIQAKKTGEGLRKEIELPDVIFIPPYKRTELTLQGIIKGWPELENVRVVADERIRELEHGLALIYNDWRVFFALHPEQRQLHDLEKDYWYRYPQGENVPDVRLRNRAWLGTLTRDYAGLKVLVVTHHLNILATRANLERFEASEFIRLDRKEKPYNCGVTIYQCNPDKGKNGKLILKLYNKKFY